MERKPRERYRVEFKVRALTALDANGGKSYRTVETTSSQTRKKAVLITVHLIGSHVIAL
ncbi:MAG TPA: hypothetical protein VHD90_27450 [Phototrophicaceae bacterium]|nr:hypothetical protein [Phototrophicaceae bacterium]